MLWNAMQSTSAVLANMKMATGRNSPASLFHSFNFSLYFLSRDFKFPHTVTIPYHTVTRNSRSSLFHTFNFSLDFLSHDLKFPHTVTIIWYGNMIYNFWEISYSFHTFPPPPALYFPLVINCIQGIESINQGGTFLRSKCLKGWQIETYASRKSCFWGITRRANLSVRFTDKNGDHAEAGKI